MAHKSNLWKISTHKALEQTMRDTLENLEEYYTAVCFESDLCDFEIISVDSYKVLSINKPTQQASKQMTKHDHLKVYTPKSPPKKN